ncbi:MAG: DUF397 domain-containing protein [Micromonosporaceae bacterium]|nr:DUF397 domain-containing protein [Micromonosporaceae bacterium]
MKQYPKELAFRKSSYCESGACVEVGGSAAFAFVRDSKDPGGPALAISRGGWDQFMASIRTGRLG